MVGVARRTDRYVFELAGGGVFPERGEYIITYRGTTPWSAILCCPGCGNHVNVDDHEIAETGEVNPSLGCPSEDCDWHEYVRLEGWPG